MQDTISQELIDIFKSAEIGLDKIRVRNLTLDDHRDANNILMKCDINHPFSVILKALEDGTFDVEDGLSYVIACKMRGMATMMVRIKKDNKELIVIEKQVPVLVTVKPESRAEALRRRINEGEAHAIRIVETVNTYGYILESVQILVKHRQPRATIWAVKAIEDAAAISFDFLTQVLKILKEALGLTDIKAVRLKAVSKFISLYGNHENFDDYRLIDVLKKLANPDFIVAMASNSILNQKPHILYARMILDAYNKDTVLLPASNEL